MSVGTTSQSTSAVGPTGVAPRGDRAAAEPPSASPDGAGPRLPGQGRGAVPDGSETSTAPVDRIITELGRQARDLATGLPGPLRRIRVRSGDRMVEIEWHEAAGHPDGSTAAWAVPMPSPAPDSRPDPEVVAPMVGTFYRAAEPGGTPFVALGDQVRPGQVVGIVEAMKLMNQVIAEAAGTVIEVLVHDGQPVEYGQPLLRLAPATDGGG